MIRFYLIRHGMTESNKRNAYIGSTDEALSDDGIKAIEEKKANSYYPESFDRLFVSPMLRCRMTASIITDMKQEIVEDFREFDFGIFEGRNADEMVDDQEYRAWVNSMCEAPVPGGDCRKNFMARVQTAFQKLLDEIINDKNTDNNRLNKNDGNELKIGIVAHGGTIMSILCLIFEGEFYDYLAKNGEMIEVLYDEKEIWNKV